MITYSMQLVVICVLCVFVSVIPGAAPSNSDDSDSSVVWGVLTSTVNAHPHRYVLSDDEVIAADSQRPSVHFYQRPDDLAAKSDQAHRSGKLSAAPPIKFIPPYIDFKERPLCMPAVQSFSIQNTASSGDITILGITCESKEFFTDLRRKMTVKPKGSISIPMIFLPRKLGHAEITIHVHTSAGQQAYQLHGQGVANSYQLVPLIGIKTPEAPVYHQQIVLFNPHATPLHVQEVVCRGTPFGLWLATGPPAPAEVWEVPAFSSKTVVSVSFQPMKGLYEDYVLLRTDVDTFIVPIEIDVVKGGLSLFPESLNFETFTTPNERRNLTLSVLNAGHAPVDVKKLEVAVNDGMVALRSLATVLPVGQWTAIADVSFKPNPNAQGEFHGRVLVKTQPPFHLEVGYFARAVYGGFEVVDIRNTSFATGLAPAVHPVFLTNKFSVPVQILRADIVDRNFQIDRFTPGAVIPPDATQSVVQLLFSLESSYGSQWKAVAFEKRLAYTTELTLITNVSTIAIPIRVYHGQIEVTTNERLELDVGPVAIGQHRQKYINVTNPNPLQMKVYLGGHSMNGSMPRTTDAVPNPNRRFRKGDLLGIVPAESNASVMFTINTSHIGKARGELLLQTQFQDLYVSFIYEGVKGTLSFAPASLKFNPSFPGRVSKLAIHVESTFTRTIDITHVNSNDARIAIQITNRQFAPMTKTLLGYAVFDPTKTDDKLMNEYRAASAQSKTGESLGRKDQQAIRKREDAWLALERAGLTRFEARIFLETNVMSSINMSVEASLMKPTILDDDVLDFPLTQVDATSNMTVVVYNPSDRPVHMQITMDFDRGRLTDTATPVPLTLQQSIAQSVTPFMFDPATIAVGGVVVPAGTRMSLGDILFTPTAVGRAQATVYVKNNLTIFEQITLRGEGGFANFQLFEELGGPNVTELFFNIQREHLSACLESHRTTEKYLGPQVFLREFVAVNKGNMPMRIEALNVDGIDCAARGFAVRNCSQFMLDSLESVPITIAFQPDFRMARVARQLHVHTSHGLFAFPLVAAVPPELLEPCASRLQPSHIVQVVRYPLLFLALLGAAFLGRAFIFDVWYDSEDNKTADEGCRGCLPINATVPLVQPPPPAQVLDPVQPHATVPVEPPSVPERPVKKERSPRTKPVVQPVVEKPAPVAEDVEAAPSPIAEVARHMSVDSNTPQQPRKLSGSKLPKADSPPKAEPSTAHTPVAVVDGQLAKTEPASKPLKVEPKQHEPKQYDAKHHEAKPHEKHTEPKMHPPKQHEPKQEVRHDPKPEPKPAKHEPKHEHHGDVRRSQKPHHAVVDPAHSAPSSLVSSPAAADVSTDSLPVVPSASTLDTDVPAHRKRERIRKPRGVKAQPAATHAPAPLSIPNAIVAGPVPAFSHVRRATLSGLDSVAMSPPRPMSGVIGSTNMRPPGLGLASLFESEATLHPRSLSFEADVARPLVPARTTSSPSLFSDIAHPFVPPQTAYFPVGALFDQRFRPPPVGSSSPSLFASDSPFGPFSRSSPLAQALGVAPTSATDDSSLFASSPFARAHLDSANQQDRAGPDK